MYEDNDQVPEIQENSVVVYFQQMLIVQELRRMRWTELVPLFGCKSRFPMVSLGFFIDIILPAALLPCGRFRL